MDARKLKGHEIWGCAKVRGAKIKGAKLKGARIFMGVRYFFLWLWFDVYDILILDESQIIFVEWQREFETVTTVHPKEAKRFILCTILAHIAHRHSANSQLLKKFSLLRAFQLFHLNLYDKMSMSILEDSRVGIFQRIHTFWLGRLNVIIICLGWTLIQRGSCSR